MFEGRQRKILAGTGAVVAAVILGMWLFHTGGGGAESLRPAEVSQVARSEQPVVLSPTEAAFESGDRLSAEDETPKDDAASEEELDDRIDRTENSVLRIKVTDARGTPVSQAMVRAAGLRTIESPGSWYGNGNGVRDETDSAGIAELSHPRWSLGIGGAWSGVSRLCFTVQHPSFVTQDVEGDVTLDEIVVVMQQGAVLVVSGWIGDPTQTILDVRPRLNYQVELTSDDWVPLRDGRLSCNKIPPGDHIISLSHERAGVPYSSAGTEFALAIGEQVELHLELSPPRRLRGSLDESVPRPIESGVVTVGVASGSRERGATLRHESSAPVSAEGEFEVADLPPGEIEIIGFCEGWVSVRPPLEDRPDGRGNQFVPAGQEGEFVLRMEPTSRVRVTVLGASGEPLEGALVQMSPNVHWKSGSAGFFAARSSDIGALMKSRHWQAITDAEGSALLENLLPGDRASLYIRALGLVMPSVVPPWGGSPRRGAWVTLVSGETATIRVQLEPGED